MPGADRQPLAVFRLDASPEIGGGHAARCAALATALATLGWDCAFAGAPETPAASPALGRWRFVPLLPAVRDGGPDEAAAIAAATGPADLLVVDHYGLGAAFETAGRRFARSILVIEDLPDRVHDCDLLLDPALDRAPGDYRARVPDGCRLLLGPAWAPLRPEFAARRPAIGRSAGPLRRLLVNMGATDPANVTAVVLDGLERSRLADGTRVDVALTSAAPHLADVRRRAAASRLQVTVLADAPSMAALMADADLAIGAAGSASWERCCLGLPTVLLMVAENQRANADALARHGAAVAVPAEADAVATAISGLAGDPEGRRRMALAALRICDGRGAARVAAAIDPPRARDGRPVTLRPATPADAADLLAWRRDPAARAFARNPEAPSEEEHARWLEGRLADPGCLINVILHGDAPAGTVRLDPRPGRSHCPYEVSINIAAGSRRLGIGRAALALARRLVPEAGLCAYVMAGNSASRALFADAGFQPAGEPDWYAAPPLAAEAGAGVAGPHATMPAGAS